MYLKMLFKFFFFNASLYNSYQKLRNIHFLSSIQVYIYIHTHAYIHTYILLASLNSLFIYQYVLVKDKKKLVIYIFILLIRFNIDLLYSLEAKLKKPRLVPKVEIKQSMIKSSNGHFPIIYVIYVIKIMSDDHVYPTATFQEL